MINLGEGDILSELKSSNNNLRLQVNRLKNELVKVEQQQQQKKSWLFLLLVVVG